MRETAMLHQLSGASGVDDSNIGLHEDIRRARISVGRQTWRIEQQIQGRTSIDFTNSGSRSLRFQHGDRVRGLAGSCKLEKREIVSSGSDLVTLGVGEQRGNDRRRRLTV